MALVDFHMHTTVSDGVWTPARLFEHIRARGMELFSITDHDTMDVYPVPGDMRAACVPGMEVDTKCNGVTAHLLVYGIRSKDAPLLLHLRGQREARKARMQEMVTSLQTQGMAITMNDVERQAGSAASVGRPHLARALVERGIVSTVQEAFDRYISDEGDAYVALARLESRDAIALAHESAAIVSIAHPARFKAPATIDVLREAGADAIEAVHPSADAAFESQIRSYAHKYGLLVTGGSDFHAPAPGYEPGVTLSERDVDRFVEKIQPG
jgi:predicted metal-dependent phosphoesterase TrpH